MWNLLAYCKGNPSAQSETTRDCLALYLAVADAEDLPLHWQRSAAFTLTLEHPSDITRSKVKETAVTFNAHQVDWGFSGFAKLKDLRDEGFVENDTLTVSVSITVRAVDEAHAGWDSYKETGHLGLKNQGATCYMNSLLQTLYSVNQFRKAVYNMPTSEDDDPSSSMPLALQSVFYKLQFTKDGPVSTKDLTRSFGWDSLDAFQQHDVQELFMILSDRLEEKMKSTRVEGLISKLFCGKKYNYISCVDIKYESTRTEVFADLQLEVKGCPTIYDSFDKLVKAEMLEGNDAYEAEGHGKQRARMGALLEETPPVLFLHLTRFEYDFYKDMQVKINDRYEFYDELDLDIENRKYWSEKSNANIRNKYKLLAVMVHSGGSLGGHYYAFIRRDGKEWLKFDDETVSKAEEDRAIKDNFGGDMDPSNTPKPGAHMGQRFPRFANAYMLVYVRESDWDSVMSEVSESDISEHVGARLRAELAEKEKRTREKAEAHLYTLVRVATDADIKGQVGSSRFFDLVDFDHVKTFKVKKKILFDDLRALVWEEFGVPVEQQRYWKWAKRQNETYRPASIIQPHQDLKISDIREGARYKETKAGQISQINLFLETPLPGQGSLQPHNKGDILIFFKQYMPAETSGTLSFVRRMLIPKSTKVEDLYPVLRVIAGFKKDQDIELWEEVKSEPQVMVEKLLSHMTLESSSLEDGDIIIFQKKVDANDAVEFPHVADFMKYIKQRIIVSFKRYDDPGAEEGSFQLELVKDLKHQEVSEAVAEELGLDHPLKLRFYQHNIHTGLPRPQPLRWITVSMNDGWTLDDMIRYSYINVPLYYEVIDLPLPEFDNLMTLRVAFHDSKHEEVSAHTVRLARNAPISELLELVRGQLKPTDHCGRPLRLMEIYQWRIWQIFDPKADVATITDNPWHLRAEVVPEDEETLECPDQLHVQCQQVQNENNRAFAFSDPFIIKIDEEETVGELKKRVQKQLCIPDKEFCTWIAVLVTSMSAPEPLDDEVVITRRIPKESLVGSKLYERADAPAIGFEHKNLNIRKTQIHLNRNPSFLGQERALKIKA